MLYVNMTVDRLQEECEGADYVWIFIEISKQKATVYIADYRDVSWCIQ